MARICKACGRDLDATQHIRGPDELRPVRRGRGRVGLQKVRTWGCRVRLIATSPVSGKTLIPGSAQRIKALDQRFVHEHRFDLDLKPE